MADNPWTSGTVQSEETSPAPANAWNQGADAGASNTDWLDQGSSIIPDDAFNWLHPFSDSVLPFDVWVNNGLNWTVDNFRPVFQMIRVPVDTCLTAVDSLLTSMPDILIILIMSGLAYRLSGRALAIGTSLSLIAIGLIGAWYQAMVTLALVITSVLFCIVIGLPLGIWISQSERALKISRPLLDAMQTTPAFVYLVPIVMLLGIGNVPGVVVTIIFALPPLIRLTNLGIRQVPEDLVEAGKAFGASSSQLLLKIKLPLAMPTIMAGINQTLMLALSMVVIASMIAVGGLGQMVLRGIGRLDMGLAAIGGLGIVLLAIVLDRLTQTVGSDKKG